jgi:hypothetical protein
MIITDFIIGYIIGVLLGLLIMSIRDAVKSHRKRSAKVALNSSRRNTVSKKDAKYARSMYRLEDEQDAMNAVDYGEAYNFHMDCGDR